MKTLKSGCSPTAASPSLSLSPDWIFNARAGALVIDPNWPEPGRSRAVWACSQPADKGHSTEGLLSTSDLAQRQKQALLLCGSMRPMDTSQCGNDLPWFGLPSTAETAGYNIITVLNIIKSKLYNII